MMEKAAKRRKKDSDRHIAEIVEEILRLSEKKSPVEKIAEEKPKTEPKAEWVSEAKDEGDSFIAHQNYVMVSRNYQLFLESLNEPYTSNLPKNVDLYSESQNKGPEPGFEVISYKERLQVARNVQMNALLGGGHNYVPPKDMESYKYWTIASKFNQLLSFLMYDRVTGGG
jgi:hypothetical protein